MRKHGSFCRGDTRELLPDTFSVFSIGPSGLLDPLAYWTLWPTGPSGLLGPLAYWALWPAGPSGLLVCWALWPAGPSGLLGPLAFRFSTLSMLLHSICSSPKGVVNLLASGNINAATDIAKFLARGAKSSQIVHVQVEAGSGLSRDHSHSWPADTLVFDWDHCKPAALDLAGIKVSLQLWTWLSFHCSMQTFLMKQV